VTKRINTIEEQNKNTTTAKILLKVQKRSE